MKRICVLMGLLSTMTILGGFSAETLIKTQDGFVPIEFVPVGTMVAGCDENNEYIESNVIFKSLHKVPNGVSIEIDDDMSITTSLDQLFYCVNQYEWKMAKDLSPGDMLLGELYTPIIIKNVTVIDHELILYNIAVKDCHNFLVLKNGILVHNFFPAVYIGLSWAFGLGAIEFSGVTLGIGCVAIGIGCLVDYLRNEYSKYKWFNKKTSTVSSLAAEKAATAAAVAGSEFVAGVQYAAGNVATVVSEVALPAGASVIRLDLGTALVETTATQVIGTAVAAVAAETTLGYAKHKVKQKVTEITDTAIDVSFDNGDKNYKCPVHSNCYRAHPHGLYHQGDKSYHREGGKMGGKKSPAPIDGQSALDCSVPIKPGSATSFTRIGVSCGQIVEFRRTSPGFYHGFVVECPKKRSSEGKALQKAGWMNKLGKMIE